MIKATSKKVLLISHDLVGPKMGGAGIRYFELAKQLSRHFTTTLATPNKADFKTEAFETVHYTSADSFPNLIDQNDVIIAQLLEPKNVRYAYERSKTLIYDFYNLIPIEYLGSLNSNFDPSAADGLFKQLLIDYQLFLRSGQYFMCSNERQADCLVGMMAANQAILPSLAQGKSWRDLVGLVPFGLDAEPPKKTKSVLRDVIPGISHDDFVIVWAGGIWDWFDPLTLIQAMAELKTRADIKLVFMATRHPNPEIGRTKMTDKAIKLSKELGLEGQSVFFLPGWISFSERANYLLEADAAASIHFDTIETRYAFRTRILDHFWSGLPSLVTEGDWFADYIRQNQLGEVVPYSNATALSQAILKIKDDASYRARLRTNVIKTAKNFTWEATTNDLIQFIQGYGMPTAAASRTLSFNETDQRLIEENERQREQIALQAGGISHLEKDNTNLRRDLSGILNSRKWKLVSGITKLYRPRGSK